MKKIKTIFILLLAILIVVVAIFGFKQFFDGPTNPFKSNDEKLMGIIQIGGSKLDYDYSTVDKYFTTREFDTIEFGGTEKYLIVPKEDVINIYSLELNDDGGLEEKYIKSMNEPFYITCNLSDIVPNSLLRIQKGADSFSYSPYISLRDGSLVVEEFVLHIQ